MSLHDRDRFSSSDLPLARRLALSERSRARARGPQGRTRVRPALHTAGKPTLVAADFNIVKDSDPDATFRTVRAGPSGFSLAAFLKQDSNGGVLERHWVYIRFGRRINPSDVEYWGLTFGLATVENLHPSDPLALGAYSGQDILGYVNAVNADWDPATLTWNNQPVNPNSVPSGGGAAPLRVEISGRQVDPGTYYSIGAMNNEVRVALIRQQSLSGGLGGSGDPLGLLVRAELFDVSAPGDVSCTLKYINDAFVSFK